MLFDRGAREENEKNGAPDLVTTAASAQLRADEIDMRPFVRGSLLAIRGRSAFAIAAQRNYGNAHGYFAISFCGVHKLQSST